MNTYPKYKNSEIEWLGKIPEHWQCLQIKRLSTVKRGASPRPIDDPKYFDENGEYAWVRIADVTASERYLTNTTQRLSELGASLSVKQEPNDFFVSIAGTVGKPIITKIKCCIHDGFVWFPALEKKYSEYFYYIFTAGELFKGLGKWGTQLNLNTETVGDIYIGLPPDKETDEIIDYLDHKTSKIDNLISIKEKQIELLKDERIATINQSVTKGLNPKAKMKDSGIEWLGEIPEHWETAKLKFVANLKSGDGITADDISETGTYPVYGGNGMRGYTSSFTHEGDYVLIGRQGALCGNINYAKGKFWASEHAVVVTVNKDVNVIWLGELLRTMNLNQYSMTAAQPGLAVEQVKNLSIPVPISQEQQAIADYLYAKTAKIDKSISDAEKQIELLKEYRTALISEAVTGKIDIRGRAAV